MANKRKNDNYVTDKTTVAKQQAKKAQTSKKTKGVLKQVLIITISVLLIAGVITGFVFLMKACSTSKDITFEDPKTANFEVTHTVQIKIKGYDEVIEIDLYGKEAPKTVEFLVSALESYKDKEITIGSSSDYVTFSNGEDKNIKGEYYQNNSSTTNNVDHVAGVITMHKTGLYMSSGYDFDLLLTSDASLNKIQAAVGFVKDEKDIEFVKKLVAEYKASKTGSTSSTTTSTDLVFGENKITITTPDLEKEDKVIERTFAVKTTGSYVFTSSIFKSLVVKLGDETVESFDTNTLKSGAKLDLVADREYTIVLGIEGLTKGEHIVKITGEVLHVGSNTVTFEKPSTNTDTSTDTTTDTSTSTDTSKSAATETNTDTTTDTTTGTSTNTDTSSSEQTTPIELVYNFTAPSTSVYVFKSESSKVTIDKIKAENGEVFETTTLTLQAGKTYEIYMTAEAAGDHIISITEKTVYMGTNSIKYELSDKKNGEITEKDKDGKETTTKYSYIEYVFAAEKTGTHIFELLSKDGKAISDAKDIKVFKDGTLVGDKAVNLTKNEVYTIRILVDELTKGTEYQVKVSNEINAGSNSVVILKDGTTTYYFTPEKTGMYVFYSTSSDISVKFDVQEVGSETSLGANTVLEAGKTYVVTMSSVDATNAPTTLEKNTDVVAVAQSSTMSFGTNSIKIPEGIEDLTFEYTAAATGIYSIKISDASATIVICDAEGNAIEGADVENIILEKGTTYQIKLDRTVTVSTDYQVTIASQLPVIESVTVITK